MKIAELRVQIATQDPILFKIEQLNSLIKVLNPYAKHPDEQVNTLKELLVRVVNDDINFLKGAHEAVINEVFGPFTQALSDFIADHCFNADTSSIIDAVTCRYQPIYTKLSMNELRYVAGYTDRALMAFSFLNGVINAITTKDRHSFEQFLTHITGLDARYYSDTGLTIHKRATGKSSLNIAVGTEEIIITDFTQLLNYMLLYNGHHLMLDWSYSASDVPSVREGIEAAREVYKEYIKSHDVYGETFEKLTNNPSFYAKVYLGEAKRAADRIEGKIERLEKMLNEKTDLVDYRRNLASILNKMAVYERRNVWVSATVAASFLLIIVLALLVFNVKI